MRLFLIVSLIFIGFDDYFVFFLQLSLGFCLLSLLLGELFHLFGLGMAAMLCTCACHFLSALVYPPFAIRPITRISLARIRMIIPSLDTRIISSSSSIILIPHTWPLISSTL